MKSKVNTLIFSVWVPAFFEGRLDLVEWNVDWNGGMEWNFDNLDCSNVFSPPYYDHL